MSLTRRLKQYLLAGFIIVAPVSITVFLLVTFVHLVDGLMAPLVTAAVGRNVPGVGLVTAAALMLFAGFLGSNLSGKHLVESFEDILLHIPVFSWLYGTVKQLTEVFSPGGTGMKFESVVLIEYPRPGVFSLGFVTKRIVPKPAGAGPSEPLFCVYVATNHLYIGDIVLVPAAKVLKTRLTLQEGIQCFLSAGATIPAELVLDSALETQDRGPSREGPRS